MLEILASRHAFKSTSCASRPKLYGAIFVAVHTVRDRQGNHPPETYNTILMWSQGMEPNQVLARGEGIKPFSNIRGQVLVPKHIFLLGWARPNTMSKTTIIIKKQQRQCSPQPGQRIASNNSIGLICSAKDTWSTFVEDSLMRARVPLIFVCDTMDTFFWKSCPVSCS